MSEPLQAKRYIGIDLGTTFCAMAYVDAHGTPVTIPNAEGSLTTPSVVFFEPSGQVTVGADARAAAVKHPQLVIECVKREMGERFYNREIQGRKLPPPAISALILKKLKQDAEAKLGPIDGAVITVPAYFDEGRRQATLAAGEIAGLEVLDILNEPTAASLAFAYRDIKRKSDGQDDVMRLADENNKSRIAVVYDLGGGTFDVTVLRIEGNNLTVLATDGDVQLGGKDWDTKLLNASAAAFKAKHQIDPRADEHVFQQMLVAAEDCKRALSARDKARMTITFANKPVNIEVTRDQFEDLTADLLYRTESRIIRVMEASGLSWHQVDDVLTVGGSTRMPQVLKMLERVTDQKPNTSLAPDEVVAHGAAIHAAITQLKRYQKQQQTLQAARTKPMAQAVSEMKIADDNDVLPMVDVDPNADTAANNGIAPHSGGASTATTIAIDSEGSTITEAIIEDANPSEQYDANDATDVLRAIQTRNVNAHGLGVIMTQSDKTKVNSVIVPSNTLLPTSVTRRYGTAVANQTSVSIVVVEGEADNPDQCIPIGKCTIKNLPWGLRKGSTIYVTFSYDNSGRLDVKAIEATSGISANTAIDRTNAMNSVEIGQAKETVKKTTVS
ncbi:MAG: Hsp70 family protein [Phycisphaeraceae bacterium]|nr:Hsp70 family protein [Phycisphaeraceae bacterium]